MGACGSKPAVSDLAEQDIHPAAKQANAHLDSSKPRNQSDSQVPSAHNESAMVQAKVSDAEVVPLEQVPGKPKLYKSDSEKFMNPEQKAMVEDSLQQALGLPYSVFESGPYEPPCQEDRCTYSEGIGLLADNPPDPQVAHILSSLAQVFPGSSVLLTLCGRQQIWIRNAIGFAPGTFPWRWAFCGWSLAPPTPQVMVVQDTWVDARFRDNMVVKGQPHIRHFAGAPLIASNSHRLGTICFLGPQPRVVTAQEATLLANMAELVVRELEKQAVAAAVAKQRTVDEAVPLDMYMMRSVGCFLDQAVAFVDTQPELWQALHCNMALSNETDITYDRAVERPFWELFAAPFEVGSEPWNATREVAARGGEFVVRGCSLRDAPQLGLFTLTFRPADRTPLDDDTQLIGVPSEVPAEFDVVGRYYFCLINAAGHTDSISTTSTTSSLDGGIGLRQQMAPQTPVPGLELGPLLGTGSFGRVYRGRYKGRKVAVKVCSGALSQGRGKRNKPWAGVEAVTARRLNHPNVIQTYKHTAVLVQEGRFVARRFESGDMGSLDGSESHNSWAPENIGDDWGDSFSAGDHNGDDMDTLVEMETWSIMEYLDQGTLQSGIDKGFFRVGRTCQPPHTPDIGAVLHTASQLASALKYLHSQDITHGDLCGGNVLLTTDKSLPHGFSCKVADFGLSRELNFQSAMQTASYGTVTHMPPELLTEGTLSKAADAYAFGVLLWEMTNSSRAWAGMSHTQVLTKVGMERARLVWLPGTHPGIMALANACMNPVPEGRPAFAEIRESLQGMLGELQQQQQQQQQDAA